MIRKVLVVQSSSRIEGSISRQLVNEFTQQLQAGHAGEISVVTRDLVTDPAPLLQPEVVQALRTPDPDEKLRAQAADSETLIAELKACDLLVIGAPMYNWGVSGALKAWIDQIVRMGYTFGYGAAGVEGLLAGKPALVVLARGGIYSTPEKASADFQKPYLDQVLRVMGIVPEFVVCEGTLLGEETLNSSLSSAREALGAIAKRYS